MYSKQNPETQVLSTDLLIIGGGIAGVMAAIKAGEKGVKVLVVEKAVTGWAGEVPTTGGYSAIIPPGYNLDDFVQWAAENGDYLSNQDWSRAFGGDLYKTIMEVAGWGLPFHKEGNEVKIFSKMKHYANVVFYPKTFMLKLKKVAVTKGVTFLDKVFVSDLIVQDGAVSGAVGIGVIDGKFYLMKSKGVIIATGGVRSKRPRGFSWCNGEGVRMAYQAGAELTNAEFLNHYIPFSKEWTASTRQAIYYFYVNNKGEKVVVKHFPEMAMGLTTRGQMEDQIKITEAVAREIMAGNGPVRLDTSTGTPEELAVARGTYADYHIVRHHKLLPDPWELPRVKAGIDIEKEKIEMEPVFIGGQGTIRVDLDCRTSLGRLWAAGDACAVGCSWAGARTTGTYPAVGIPFGMVSGFRAGVSIGTFVREASEPRIDLSQVERSKEKLYAPLAREKGPNYRDLIVAVHGVTMPMKYNFFRRGDRLKEAIEKIEEVKDKLKQAPARDSHELVKLLETESLAVSAEMTFRAALMRTESRGSHKREDFPKRDDDNWLKWIVIKRKDDKMELRTEPVPLERYPFKPKR